MFKYRLYYRYFKGVQLHKVLDLIRYKKAEVIDELKESLIGSLMLINILKVYLQDFMKDIGYLKNLAMIKEELTFQV